ncbi:hypothetical protein VitviT2T_013738 [Vitis vinifera]|uniref:Uncharacterized protein n=1 Tax=Vitis vinifera TaxID=29760 RepID=A0ABY9CK32_VITVI|nr:hypothetical protein VitviT2T_013738 [Vitis vinifera]
MLTDQRLLLFPSPNISHPEFCPVQRSTFFGYLTSRILSGPTFHFLRISHIRNSVRPNVPSSPDISHPKFCPPTFHLLRISHIWNSVRPNIPSFFGYLTSGILSGPTFHLLRISHIRNYVRPNVPSSPDISRPEFCPPTFHLLRIFHVRNSVRRHFTFSGYLTSGILSADIPSFSEYLTSGILSVDISSFFGYLTSGILSADVPPSPDISHPEFCLTDVPPSPDISHPPPNAEWERRAIQLPRSDMSGSSSLRFFDWKFTIFN